MKKYIILLSIVLIMSCTTTEINYFDNVSSLTTTDYNSLSFNEQLIICEGFLIGTAKFNGKYFMVTDVSAMQLKKQVDHIIQTSNPRGGVIINIFHVALYSLINSRQDA